MRNCFGYNIRLTPGVWCGLAIVGCVYFLIALFTPLLYDDLNFSEMYQRANGGDVALSFDSWWNYLKLIRGENDGRFGNSLEIVFAKWPQWIFAVFMGFWTMVWVCGSTLLASGREGMSAWSLGLVWLLLILFLPWHDNILGCMNFELNYVVSSGVASLFLVLLYYAGKGFRSRILQVICIIAAFAGGGFHEGFSLPIVCGFVGWLVLKGKRPSSLQLGMLVAAGLGICVDMISGGIHIRLEETQVTLDIPLRNVARCLTLPCLLTAGAVGAMFFRQGRRWLKDLWTSPVISLLTLIWVCAMIMALAFKAHGRVTWIADWIAGVLAVAVIMRTKLCRGSRYAKIGLWVLLIAFYCNVVYHQYRFYREANEVMALFEQSSDGVVDYDWTPAAPVTTLHHVCRMNIHDEWAVTIIERWDSQHRRLRVRVDGKYPEAEEI